MFEVLRYRLIVQPAQLFSRIWDLWSVLLAIAWLLGAISRLPQPAMTRTNVLVWWPLF